MYVIGAVLWIVFIGYEWKFAKYPIMPKRVLNRSLICSCIIDFVRPSTPPHRYSADDQFYFLSYYVAGTYWLSWVYVVKDWSVSGILH